MNPKKLYNIHSFENIIYNMSDTGVKLMSHSGKVMAAQSIIFYLFFHSVHLINYASPFVGGIGQHASENTLQHNTWNIVSVSIIQI